MYTKCLDQRESPAVSRWNPAVGKAVGSLFLLEALSMMHRSAEGGAASQTRDVTINIRVKQSQRDLIDHAAEVQGKSRSEFMLESAYQKAQEVLLDQSFFGLDELKFQQFEALLDAPPQSDERLHQLLTTKAPWD